jgi:predicted RNA-binding Zn-ribbon protein involved in translation (DUF1610 family)
VYCYHCGKKINEASLEHKKSSYALANGQAVDGKTSVAYVCPRCGHLITEGAKPEEIKSLSRAAHAQVQRAKNSFATGMGSVSIGTIALIISILFYFLAKKPSNHYVLVTTCAEFYVFLVLLIISVILLSVGGFYTIWGLVRQKSYENLLKDINNQTFIQ